MGRIEEAKALAKNLIDTRGAIRSTRTQLTKLKNNKPLRTDFLNQRDYRAAIHELQYSIEKLENELKDLIIMEGKLVKKILDLLDDYRDRTVWLFHKGSMYSMTARTIIKPGGRQGDDTKLLLSKA